MPIVRDYQGKNDVLTIRRENGDGLNQEKALLEDGADHDCGEALCWKAVMELAQWPFPSMAEGLGVHTVD